MNDDFLLPPSMAAGAPGIDGLFSFILWFSIVFTIVITGVMCYFLYAHRRRPGVKSEPTPHYTKLELTWTVIPIFIVVWMFHASFDVYVRNQTAAEGATEIRVRAKKWSWEFEYPGGDRVPQELHLEVNKPVKFVMSSDDVIHSFYIPEFRWKRDVVPGQYSYMAVTPTKTGAAHVFCAEYCGTQHSGMLATVKIDTPEEYAEFKNTLGKMPKGYTPEKWGEELFTKNGCTTCHGIGGSGEVGGAKSPGPKLAGLFAKGQEQMADGAMITVDENYIRESILRPNAKIVMNYSNVQMPVFVLKDDQLDAIIAYLKTLK
jgi:cytochrome c oxidase subunit II